MLQRTCVRGSMTVEAALVLPLFCFFVISMGNAIEIIRLHGNLEVALWNAGRQIGVYGALPEGQQGSADHRLEAVAISYTYVKEQIEEQLGEEYLEISPLDGGSDGLQFLESNIEGDIYTINMTYRIAGISQLSGFKKFRMANRYYGHMWNGYEIPEPEDEEYIYITENGRVYHTNRECTHIRLSVRVVEATEALREYRPCEKCTDKIPHPTGGLLFFVLLYFYYILKRPDVRSYVWGLYVTNGIAFIASLSMLVPDFLKETSRSSGKSLYGLLKEMFAYGLWAGADGLAETCTTRLNYFLIQRFAGLGSVGLLDAGTKISESVWNISRSVSFIEYSSVAKTSEATEQKRITLQLFKLTFCALALVMGCILLVPEWIYTDYLFSAEFKGIRKVIGGLSIGIVALGCNSIISHYFIGSGKIRYSTASSCVGLIALLISGFLLIPSYGVVGSAITTSIAFTSMLVFSLTVFSRQTLTRWNEFLPDKKDFQACRIHIQKSL